MNFAVTDSFVMQKTVLNTEANTDLSTYRNLDGTEAVQPESYRTIITDSKDVRIDGKTIGEVADEFVTRYADVSTRAVPIQDLPFMVVDTAGRPLNNIHITKASNSAIYVYDR